MKNFTVTIQQQSTVKAKSPKHAATLLKSHGFNVLSVGDRDVVEWCEDCGKPIFDAEAYFKTVDEVALCNHCSRTFRKKP